MAKKSSIQNTCIFIIVIVFKGVKDILDRDIFDTFFCLINVYIFIRGPPLINLKKQIDKEIKMDKHEKRNKDKYNPYTLEVRENNRYILKFKDSRNIVQEIIISKEIYEAFDKFELEDISQIHKIRKHIEYNDVYEETLYHKSINYVLSVDEQVENNINREIIKNAINELPDIQQRRLKKYFFEDKTYDAIAIEENCTKRAVKFSIDIAIEKISKKFKF